MGVREGGQGFDSAMSAASLPGAAPSLQDEVREAEAARLRAVERENRELRGQLEMLRAQPGSQVGPPPTPTVPLASLLPTHEASSNSHCLSHMSSAPPAGGVEQGRQAARV